MKFAELHSGQVIRLGPRTVTEGEILEFAGQHDPQWFHTDPRKAAQGRWNGLIASGWHSCGIAMRMIVEGILGDSESFASPGLNYLKWTAPVRPGDRLRVEVVVLETKISSSGSTGSVLWIWRMFNQDEVMVLELEATNLFELGAGRKA
ncbi:MAG: acyl dehydratase [Panacagrimonas sp.]|jgi:acyl dehydratase|nr:MaoC family dehydratase [Panacagrimonas sp.]MCC2658249.1 acyl dehydratase [Panacagrimonas sp.]